MTKECGIEGTLRVLSSVATAQLLLQEKSNPTVMVAEMAL